MRKFKKLLQADIEAKTAPAYYGDGLGLWLRVAPGGAKSWAFRYRGSQAGNHDGNKQREMSLGPCHTVSLDQARLMAAEYRLMRLRGIDPIDERRRQQAAAKLEAAKQITFNGAATTYIDDHASEWKNPKHVDQWRNTLATYAGPIFGNKAIANVNTDDVVACLKPIWTRKNETAMRIRGRIESVLDWATVMHFRSGDNPARWKGHLEHLLPNVSRADRVEHHPALPYAKASDFMLALRQQAGIGAACLRFAILTATRSGEVRGAAWSEIDLDAGLWIIPASRMKASNEHRVPLNDAAIALLKPLHEAKTGDLVFPGIKSRKPLSDMSLTAILRRMSAKREKINLARWTDTKGDDITVHGFRSTFRDWIADTTSYPGEMAEIALAHKVDNKVEALTGAAT